MAVLLPTAAGYLRLSEMHLQPEWLGVTLQVNF